MVDEHDHLRPHIRVFAGDRNVRALSASLDGVETVMIVCALSGGL